MSVTLHFSTKSTNRNNKFSVVPIENVAFSRFVVQPENNKSYNKRTAKEKPLSAY